MGIAGDIVRCCSVKEICLTGCANRFEEVEAFGKSAKGANVSSLLRFSICVSLLYKRGALENAPAAHQSPIALSSHLEYFRTLMRSRRHKTFGYSL